MAYTAEERQIIVKAVLDVYYERLSLEVAKETIPDKECGYYRLFRSSVAEMEQRLNGGNPHLSTTLVFAKEYYRQLKEEDKAEWLAHLHRQVEHGEQFGIARPGLRQWLQDVEE